MNDHQQSATDYFKLNVSYKGLSREALGTVFDSITPIVDDVWVRHPSRVAAGVDDTPGEKDFWFAEVPMDFLRSVENVTDIIKWGLSRGYVGAIHEETIEFFRAHLDLLEEYWIIGLGDYVNHVTCKEERRLALAGFGAFWGYHINSVDIDKPVSQFADSPTPCRFLFRKI